MLEGDLQRECVRVVGAGYLKLIYCSQDFYNATGGIDIKKAYEHAKAAGVIKSPAFEWYQYQTGGSVNKELYPHWTSADFCMFPST